MPLDQITLLRLLQSRPEFAQLLAGATQATAPTASGFAPQPAAGGPPPDIMAEQPGLNRFLPESLTRPPESLDQGPLSGGLWERVKGFFEPDEVGAPPQTAGSYDDDISAAGWAGAAAGAAGAAQDPRSSPIQVLTQALGGYGAARGRAKADLRGEAREERLFGLKERELTAGIEEKEFERQQARDALARQEAVLAGLDPDVRAKIEPLLAFGAKEQAAEVLAPKRQNLIEVNDGLFDPNTGTFVVEPQVKPTAPFGSDALGYFQVDPTTNQPVQLVGGLGRTPQQPVSRYDATAEGILDKFSGEFKPFGPGARKPLSASGQLVADIQALPPGPERIALEAVLEKQGKEGRGQPVKVKTPDGIRYVDPQEAIQKGYEPAPDDREDKTFSNTKDLRIAYEKQAAPIREAILGFNRIQQGAKLGTGAGDIAIVFGYMKMLDPASTVREGEQATAANAAGVPESIRAQWNNLLGEGSLSQEARNQIVTAAKSQIEPYRQSYSELGKIYTGLASRSQLDPQDVVTPIQFPSARSSTGPVPRRSGGGPPSGTPMVVDPNDIMNQVGIR